MSDAELPQQDTSTSVLLHTIRTIDRVIESLEVLLIAGSVLVMAGLMITHVLGRTFLELGVPGTTEVVELLIILMTFVGVSYAARRGRHISMSAFYDQLTGKARKALLVLIALVTGALLFYLAWEAASYVDSILDRGRRTSALQIPLWLVYLAMPVGFLLAGIQYWLTALRNLTSSDIYRSFTEVERYEDVPEAEDGGNDDKG